MEENFYVIEITKYNNGTKDAYAVYSRDSQESAFQLFHQKLASALGSAVVSFELCQVINDYGVVFKSEYCVKSSEPTSVTE